MASSPPLRPNCAPSPAASLDLAGNAYRGMQLGVDLLKPPALFPNMTGQVGAHGVDARRPVRDRQLFLPADFRLRAIRRHRLHGLACRRAGQALAVADARSASASRPKRSPALATLPAPCSRTRSIEGWLSVTPKLVQAPDLRLTSAKWNGKLSLLLDLVTGRFQVTLSGRDAALPDPRPRHRRCHHRPPRRTRTGREGHARRRHRQGVGPPSRQ